jgi:serine/threonine protein kinase
LLTLAVAANGTPIKGTYNFDYAAPEIIEEAKAYPQSDAWSSGVLMYVLMSGQLPFKGDTPEETKDNIVNVKFKFEWLYKECTMEGTRLLMWIFKRLPYRRPTLEEIGAHRWMSSADYMLKKRQRAKFPTNRIQNFSREYHRSRPVMEQDSQSFITRIVHGIHNCLTVYKKISKSEIEYIPQHMHCHCSVYISKNSFDTICRQV